MSELRDLLRLVLAPDGHTVEGAANGREALARITGPDAAYDVVVTDHHMPELNGLGLVRALRKLDYRGKVVVFTSELSPEVSAAYRELNVDHVLPKPVMPPVLRELFRQL
jgi:CheY-like chemotaxis protein